MTSYKAYVKENWGYLVFLLISLTSFVTLMSRPVGGHYAIFVGGAESVLAGVNPYGNDYGTQLGEYWYSLNCALSFFSFFQLFPPFWGLLIYMLSSWLIFLFGMKSLGATVEKCLGQSLISVPYRNLFWLFLTSEMTGAILASKIEVLMLGMLFFALKFFIDGRMWVAGVVFGYLIEWKFQPLPILGLATIVALMVHGIKPSIQLVLTSAASFFAAFLLPVMWLGLEKTLLYQSVLQERLLSFMKRDWIGFQHVYTFLSRNLGMEVSFESAQIISMAVGVSFAIATFVYCRGLRKLNIDKGLYGGIFAWALGSAFIVLFSPMSQSNGYILHSSLVFGTAFSIWQMGNQNKKVFGVLLIAYFLISIAYSDLTPKGLRLYLYHHAYKPLGVLLLLGLFGFNVFRRKKLTP